MIWEIQLGVLDAFTEVRRRGQQTSRMSGRQFYVFTFCMFQSILTIFVKKNLMFSQIRPPFHEKFRQDNFFIFFYFPKFLHKFILMAPLIILGLRVSDDIFKTVFPHAFRVSIAVIWRILSLSLLLFANREFGLFGYSSKTSLFFVS